MFARRTCQRRFAWVAMIALVGGMLGSPFAHALALRVDGASSDLCSAVTPAGVAAKPMLPGGLGHAAHVSDCPCCTGSTPAIGPAFTPASALPAEDTAVISAASRSEIRPATFPARVGPTRAPPLFS
jgi:hypothetical protein